MPPWGQSHSTCLQHLAPDFDCDVEGGPVLPLAEFAEQVALLTSTHLGMEIPGPPLEPAIAPLLHNGFLACSAGVHLVLLSRAVWGQFLGNALHSTLVVKVVALAARLPEPAPTMSLESRLKNEVWDLLAAQRRSQTKPLILPTQPPLKIANNR